MMHTRSHVFRLLLLFILLTGLHAPTAWARPWGNGQCSPAQAQHFLNPAATGKRLVLPCSLTLQPGQVLRRPIVLTGAQASGLTLDCRGGSIQPPGANPMALIIRSKMVNGRWSVPQQINVRNCTLMGAVRIMGMGPNGEAPAVRDSSHYPGHTQRAQASAPSRITLSNLHIIGRGTIPLYLAPGVTQVTLQNSELGGQSQSVALYLDAESARNRIVGNDIHTNTSKRELVALDGSAGNLIAGNRFSSLQNGGIYLYRNCGEGGTVRHQPPQDNTIQSNLFFYNAYRGNNPAVWLGSRMGSRGYCMADRGYRFGSSADDRDQARYNRVLNNTITARRAADMIRVSDGPNTVAGNLNR